jgi:pyruvate/2-oxoglutarate/acetoin dehydrogenase E1 component
MIPFGKALKLIEGDHITITAYSKLVPMCREIAEELAPKIRIEVLDLRSLSPLDYESVLESVHKTGRYLSVEIGCRTGGIGAELASAVAEDCASVLRAPVRRIAAPDSSFPASRALWKYLQPSKSEIVSAIKDLVKDEISY